jgi:hypothetical protein
MGGGLWDCSSRYGIYRLHEYGMYVDKDMTSICTYSAGRGLIPLVSAASVRSHPLQAIVGRR